ncbi:MAG TPA: aminomethyl-transferring glycine dehydrogenase subunit GcvPB [Petrotogaceae bacterium]|jgi:glycine dehydrogenase subunit 2|nr:aminomethyl-transferring glycine dehydrogenase subunit GcvPB [Petrotogaceae bacterium]HNV04509.1 aminomethyl-transferring glycine dehydrogenase subunit GcvPB [Petrotogaceae bacterium]HNY37194.1 aminomethyl-transferring glycine dehydrogenase subunit GcvPB [Petrotogaceae bacterium]HPA92512.1 aminomethyl-transferring glycine dehydrogenase subunit GcvPB [Petrotogaceae bacterium]HPO27444.1 aminomethyl-transferring glycine dehydrogenase subunit GcvPB [Petrotogaceae bacterium]
MKFIFEHSVEGKKAFRLEELDVPLSQIDFPQYLLRDVPPELPQVSELDIVRHYTQLEKLNHSVDSGFYPLGSCTMKYNPFINDETASYAGFSKIHPYEEEDSVQGALELMYNLQQSLCEITGMDAITLQPAAGAHGELTGMLIIRKYLLDKGFTNKTKVIVPDSAHGTNPASAKMAGFDIVQVKSDEHGLVDIQDLKMNMTDEVAAIMLTNPNTLGIFEKNICEIQKIAHEKNALLYYDGANLNAIMGKVRPGDMGFDVVHLNLHKTFSTPHGMGGPGSGPVGVKKHLSPYLPKPVVEMDIDGRYYFNNDMPLSIGKVRSFYGNFSVMVRAYTYILMMGKDGLRRASELAVLNANYMRVKLSKSFKISHENICKHEFVINGSALKEYGVKTLDFVKMLLDNGIHPPTVYFPLIVEEAMMIEPTETENKETLDNTIKVFEDILKVAKTDPQKLHDAPFNTPVRRLDETKATKDLKVRYSIK